MSFTPLYFLLLLSNSFRANEKESGQLSRGDNNPHPGPFSTSEGVRERTPQMLPHPTLWRGLSSLQLRSEIPPAPACLHLLSAASRLETSLLTSCQLNPDKMAMLREPKISGRQLRGVCDAQQGFVRAPAEGKGLSEDADRAKALCRFLLRRCTGTRLACGTSASLMSKARAIQKL